MRHDLLTVTIAAALRLSGGVASAQQRFDGNWSVQVVTQTGSCQKAYRFPVVIQNGQVRYGGAEGIAVSGAVTSKGVIRGNFGVGSAQASVSGRLSSRTGSGTWVGSGSFNCSGQWQAEKRA